MIDKNEAGVCVEDTHLRQAQREEQRHELGLAPKTTHLTTLNCCQGRRFSKSHRSGFITPLRHTKYKAPKQPSPFTTLPSFKLSITPIWKERVRQKARANSRVERVRKRSRAYEWNQLNLKHRTRMAQNQPRKRTRHDVGHRRRWPANAAGAADRETRKTWSRRFYFRLATRGKCQPLPPIYPLNLTDAQKAEDGEPSGPRGQMRPVFARQGFFLGQRT
jgi:hypothetical protein